jgi:hypothetical protein
MRSARCALTEEDVCALLKATMHECGRDKGERGVLPESV